MEPVARLNIRHLIETMGKLPAEFSNTQERVSYFLSIAIIKHFLGENWIDKLIYSSGKRAFIEVDFDADDKEIQLFRHVDLAELLFNLQHIYGFDRAVEQLRIGQVETTISELDVARLLYINEHFFWFNPPTGSLGEDYDFVVLHKNGTPACIEAKCNLERDDISPETIRNALLRAKRQLPKNRIGIIFVKIPPKWITEQSFVNQSIKVARDFFEHTERIVSIKYYVAPMSYKDMILVQGHHYLELENPQHRFEKLDWRLLQEWRPPTNSPNSMPPKWVRLSSFPKRITWRDRFP